MSCATTQRAGRATLTASARADQMNIGPAISLLRNDATEAPVVESIAKNRQQTNKQTHNRQEQTASSQASLCLTKTSLEAT